VIAYHILCHDNLAQVVTLVESLYTGDDAFLIDIDDGKRPDLKPLEALRGRANVEIVRDANIGWGAAGTLRKTLEGAFRLLHSANWQYYVVLSGQDLALKSNERIKQRLSAGLAERTSYIRCHLAEPVELSSLPVKNAGSKPRRWEDRGHTRLWAMPGVASPHVQMYGRRLVDVTEVGELGQVYVSRCDSLVTRRRDDFFARHPLYTGPNWFTLHRSLIEHLQADPLAYELYDLMRTTFIPDESYFQTYIKNSVFRDRVDHDYGRLIVRPERHPAPKVFTVADWPVIEASDALYGRKFDNRRDRGVVQRVLQARA